ncbi:hypothetical protein ElyMa_000276900 [Elysia marginata]|uniref:Uncharacterized protein n=1 Tax=Elysia marginata TaxID=1093978 RepID=A0AAV4F524_9GAST|nr:hypothetical protein ElyMa_000276900 [Elysia marginata]
MNLLALKHHVQCTSYESWLTVKPHDLGTYVVCDGSIMSYESWLTVKPHDLGTYVVCDGSITSYESWLTAKPHDLGTYVVCDGSVISQYKERAVCVMCHEIRTDTSHHSVYWLMRKNSVWSLHTDYSSLYNIMTIYKW